MPQIYGNGESCFQFVARSCRKNEWKWCFQFMTFHLVVYVQRHSDCGCNVHSFSLTPKIVLICFHYLYQTAWKFKKVHHPQVFSCHIFQGHFPMFPPWPCPPMIGRVPQAAAAALAASVAFFRRAAKRTARGETTAPARPRGAAAQRWEWSIEWSIWNIYIYNYICIYIYMYVYVCIYIYYTYIYIIYIYIYIYTYGGFLKSGDLQIIHLNGIFH